MKTENLSLLNTIVQQKIRELGLVPLRQFQSPKLISLDAPGEKYHLETELASPVARPLPLQISICDDGATVSARLFPSPRIVTEPRAAEYIALANEANRELYRMAGLGRFWVSEEDLDFAYEILFKKEMLESHVEEMAKQLFDVPLSHFQDLYIPLVMLADGVWNGSTALRYFRQLRAEGCVDSRDYGLW